MEEQENINKDLQELINHCHLMAEQLLLEQKEFYPFGAYLDNSGQLTPSGYYGGDEFPLSDTVITGLREYLKRQLISEKIKAYAIAFDTRIKNENFPNSIDAICI